MTSTSVPKSAQLLVVGGGPAGSTTAWFAARAGLDVVLVDRARFPRTKPCAEYVSPEGARILSQMGVLESLEAQASALTGMVVHTPAGREIHGEFAAAHGFRGFRDRGLGIARERLDATLLACAVRAGARVVERAKVEQLLSNDDGRVLGARVRTADGVHTTNALLTVGADGLRSIVARRLGLARRSAWPTRVAFVAHYTGVADVSSLGEMHVTRRRGYVGLASINGTPGGVTNVAIVVPQRFTRGALQRIEPESFMREWLENHATLASRFRNAQRISAVQTTGPFASHVRRAWAPGAALVGDAADFFDPFTGEGIYAALRGAELLAGPLTNAVRAIERGDAMAETHALDSYERARRETFVGKWRIERLIGAAVAFPPLLEIAAHVLRHDRQLADLLIGVTGDFVPPSALLAPSTLWRLARASVKSFAPSLSVPAPAHVHRS